MGKSPQTISKWIAALVFLFLFVAIAEWPAEHLFAFRFFPLKIEERLVALIGYGIVLWVCVVIYTRRDALNSWVEAHFSRINAMLCEIMCEPQKVSFLSHFTRYGLMAVLLIVGIAHWTEFLSGINFAYADWPKELAYYTVLAEAVDSLQIPYHVSIPLQGTTRFLANPEIVLSPQIVLLRFLNADTFVLVNCIMCFLVGCVGCYVLKRRYGLSVFSASVLYLLLFFNGHITSHLAVGHSMWCGYFFLPFLCLFTLQILEDEVPQRAGVWLAVTLFAVVLQGSLHIYVASVLFLGVLALSSSRARWPLLGACALSSGLCAFRFIPAALAYADVERAFLGGYPSLRLLIEAMVSIHDFKFAVPATFGGWLKWWEYDAYVSIVGFAFLCYFGVYYRHFGECTETKTKWGSLDVAIASMTLLSIAGFYAPIAELPIPLVSVERVSARLIVVPLVFLIVVASIHFQRFMKRVDNRNTYASVFVALFVLMGSFLMAHSRVWQPSLVAHQGSLWGQNLSVAHIVCKVDPVYMLSMKVGWVVSLISGVIAVVYVLAKKR